MDNSEHKLMNKYASLDLSGLFLGKRNNVLKEKYSKLTIHKGEANQSSEREGEIYWKEGNYLIRRGKTIKGGGNLEGGGGNKVFRSF